MEKVKFKILKKIGVLSSRGDALQFNYVSWYGNEKYDIRRWSPDGTEPYKGITIGVDEIDDLLSSLQKAIAFKVPTNPIYIVSYGKAKVKIYGTFGSFGCSGKLEKQVTVTDWGYGCKIDIRPWAEDYLLCGKGITLSKDECNTLVDLIRSETRTTEEYGIAFEDFVVRSNVFRCNKNHELETINALISILHYNGEIENETITAGYCKQCNCYFVLEQDYADLRRNGLPLCRQITEKNYRENGDSVFDGSSLNEQSLLNQIGYNVNSAEALSSKQRQDVLSFAIDIGLYTASSICSFLDWLIERNKRVSNRDMSDAIYKWSEDREYISKYKSGSRPMKGVRSLRGKKVH